jgi:hypothetical protein
MKRLLAFFIFVTGTALGQNYPPYILYTLVNGTPTAISGSGTTLPGGNPPGFLCYGLNGSGQPAPCVIGTGSGSVTSVTFTGDGTILSSTPSAAVTTSGTLTATLATQAANCLFAGPTSGAAATPTCRALVNTDFPNTLAPTFSAANLTNVTASSVPVSGITGLGTGVATALAINTGTAGSVLLNAAAIVGTSLNLTDGSATVGLLSTGLTVAHTVASDVPFKAWLNNASPTANIANFESGTGGTIVASISPTGMVGGAGFRDTSSGFLTSAMSSQSSATCTNVTNMTWNILDSKNYTLRCEIPVTFAATSTLQFCLGGPGTATSYSLNADGPIGAAGVYGQINTLAQTAWGTKTGASGAAASTEWVHLIANIQNGSTASGTALTLQTAANGTNAITVLANASCTLTQDN